MNSARTITTVFRALGKADTLVPSLTDPVRPRAEFPGAQVVLALGWTYQARDGTDAFRRQVLKANYELDMILRCCPRCVAASTTCTDRLSDVAFVSSHVSLHELKPAAVAKSTPRLRLAGFSLGAACACQSAACRRPMK